MDKNHNKIFKYSFFYKTSTGNYRKINQDNGVCLIKKNENIVLAALCDGMGGHNYGETASQIAIDILEKEFKKEKFYNFKSNDYFYWLKNVVNNIKEYMKNYSLNKNEDKLLDMGTTFLVTIIKNDMVYVINIGDSRLYAFNLNNKLIQITKDQNILNNEKYKKMVMNNSFNNDYTIGKLLTSALGPNKKMQIDAYKLNKMKGFLLLTTDGVHDYVDKNEIQKELNKKTTLKTIVNNLMKLALDNYSTDNLTILLLKINY